MCKQGFPSWSLKSYIFSACFWSNFFVLITFLCLDRCSGPRPSPYRGFEITLGKTTLGRISLDEWSARRRDLYIPVNTHNTQTSVPPAEFEPAIPASERRQTNALDSAATGIGSSYYCSVLFGRDGSTHSIYAESVRQKLRVAVLPLVIVDRPTFHPSNAMCSS